MPQIAGALLGAAFSTGTIALFGGTFIGGSVISHFLITTALGALMNGLTPKPEAPQGSKGTGYDYNFDGTISPHAIIYGTRRVGGVRVYDESTNSETHLHRIIVLAGHEIDSVTEVYANDELLTLDVYGNVTAPTKYAGFLRIKIHLGSDTQLADSDLVNESAGKWNSNCRLQGLAYLYIRMSGDKTAFPSGAPTFTAVVKGRKVYDPRTGTTAWSDNAALCINDYLNAPFGVNIPSSKLDMTALTTAANICDELVPLAAGGTEKRYTLNGSFLTSRTRKDIIKSMLTSMAGSIFYGQGIWKVIAGAYVTPAYTFDKSDFRSNIRITATHPLRDNFNSVEGTFIGAETNWQETDFPAITSSTFLAEDNNIPAVADLFLPFTATNTMAQRIAKILLYRNREQITMTVRLNMRGMLIQVGDTIQINDSSKGWTNKVFEVVKWDFGFEELVPFVEVVLRETSAAVYNWNADEASFASNNTNLPSAFTVPAIGVTANVSVRITSEKIANVISVTVSSSYSNQITAVEVQYKKASDTSYTTIGYGKVGTFDIVDVVSGTYDIRARAFNLFGVSGSWVYSINVPTSNIGSAPNDVTGFTGQVVGGTILLSWDQSIDQQLSHYKIRHSLLESGAEWANAVTVVSSVARPGTSITVPALPGTYMIRSYDKLGAPSANYSSFVIPSTYLETFASTLTLTDSPTFPGTKTDCSVVATRLQIDNPSDIKTKTIYSEQLNTWPNVYANVVGVTNDAIAPDGTLTAELVSPDPASGNIAHYMRQANLPIVIGQNVWHNFSIYVKSKTLRYIRMRGFHLGADDEATFDIIDGKIWVDSVQTNADAKITDEGNGWYRCSISILNTVDNDTQFNTHLMSKGPYNTDENFDPTVYTGDAWFWGLQVTEGRDVKPYRKVTSSKLNNYATYEFAGYLDTGTVRRTRIRLEIQNERMDMSLGLWDDLTGSIDGLSGLWDDLTGATVQLADTDVQGQISITNDDPAGTPTWSAWYDFRAGEYYGRAFKFKAILKTEAHNISPGISTLTAKVQY